LAAEYASDVALTDLLSTLDRAPKQKEVLMNFFVLRSQSKKNIDAAGLQKKSKASASVVKALIDKGVFEEYTIREDRQDFSSEETKEVKKLSFEQQLAF